MPQNPAIDEHAHRKDRHQAERGRIRLDEVMRRTGFSRSTLYRLMGKGQFPAQAGKPKGTKTAFWFLDEIEAWIESTRRGANVEGGRADPRQSRTAAEEAIRGHARPPTSTTIESFRRRRGAKKEDAVPSGLVLTGMTLMGRPLYEHSASGLLLLEIGRRAPEPMTRMHAEEKPAILQ